jgi:hypothetical protein
MQIYAHRFSGHYGVPISRKKVDAFSQVAAEEALFLDEGSDHALRLFEDIMWRATYYEETRPK